MRGDTPKRRRPDRGEIADRNAIETAVRESEERFRAMADAAPVMIWVSDSSNQCTYFNQPWLDFVGRPLSKELGNGWAENVHQDDYDVCLQTYNSAFDARRSFTMEYRMRKNIEEQLFRAQRLESIGSLTGGIAHDLNNVLAPIAMSLEMLRLKYIDEESQGWLRILQQSTERGADLVQQVLSFARGNEGKQIEIQPRHLLVELVKVLRETFPKSIDVQFNLPGNLRAVKADPTQLHQVLMNLCVNARDAMPQGGLLTITAYNHFVDETYVRMNRHARIGRFVRIAVSDTGTGIDNEILDRIFEPFFTTKQMGKGTGLGLSTTLTIVKSHGGFLEVNSEIGQGTRMIVYLPASTDTTPVSQTDDKVRGLPSGRGALVLVIDDEESIRQITKSTLETFGYQVLTAADGTEALALFAQHRDRVAVVITDTMMPFMDGIATIRALKKLRPDLKIISASGLAGEERMPESVRAAVEVFLTKPYTAELLLISLAQVLAN